MKILRKNYFSANLFEKAEYSGTPEHLKPDAELVEIVDTLKKAQIKHRQNDEFLIWSYWFLINNKPGKNFNYSSNLVELEVFFDYQKALWTREDKIPDRLDDWIEKHCFEKVVSNTASHVLLGEGKNTFINPEKVRSVRSADKRDVNKLEALKRWHEISVKTFEDAKKVKIETVLDFLENPQWPKKEQNALTIQSQMPALETVIAELPKASEVSAEQAQKEAEEVIPDNYETIYNYAREIGTDVRKAVAVVARFAAAACPTLHATLDVVEDILERQKKIDLNNLDLMVQDNEIGFVGRMFNRQRPAPYEQTPLFEIAEIAQSIPDKAKEDSARHAEHVKVLQIGLEIIHGYDESLRAYVQALEERKKIIDQEKTHEAEELTTRDIADGIIGDSIEEKLNDLKASRAFARAHAANFATLLRPVMRSQGQKENMAGLAANVLLPMQQVQRAFMAYQTEQFGKVLASNNDIIEGTATEISATIPAGYAKDVIEQSMKTLSLMVGQMQNEMSQSRDDIIDIATQIEQAAAKGEATKVTSPQPA
jgi:hypothetical protein